MEEIERPARIAVDCGFRPHEALGPGLLESVYEACLYRSLAMRGLGVERKAVPIRFGDLTFEEGFRADLLRPGGAARRFARLSLRFRPR